MSQVSRLSIDRSCIRALKLANACCAVLCLVFVSDAQSISIHASPQLQTRQTNVVLEWLHQAAQSQVSPHAYDICRLASLLVPGRVDDDNTFA